MIKKYRKIYLFISILLLAGYSWLGYALYVKGSAGNFSVCMFHNITGYPCPSCGITRSVMELISGEFLSAIMINPIGLIALAALIILPILIIHDLVTGKTLFVRLYEQMEKQVRKPKIAIVLIILVVVNWFWNIYKEL